MNGFHILESTYSLHSMSLKQHPLERETKLLQVLSNDDVVRNESQPRDHARTLVPTLFYLERKKPLQQGRFKSGARSEPAGL